MNILFLDLASHDGLIAVVSDDRILIAESLDHRIDDAELVPAVESVLQKTGWSYPDLTNIACVVGPGGFTSLRVAVALANTLSSQLNIPSCGIHLSDVYFARVSASTPASTLTWIHSTKKNELFIRVSDEEPRCITIDELKNILKKDMHWMGELIPEHRKIVDETGVQESKLKPLQEILPTFIQTQEFNRRILKPWYGRGW